MKNKKKLGIFSFIICLLTTVFVFSLNKTFAETPEVSVTGKFVDAITDVKVVNNEGGDLTLSLIHISLSLSSAMTSPILL